MKLGLITDIHEQVEFGGSGKEKPSVKRQRWRYEQRETDEVETALAGLMAHNLMRELQMRACPPQRGTTMTRAARWIFDKAGT